jgi:hypothetical protein
LHNHNKDLPPVVYRLVCRKGEAMVCERLTGKSFAKGAHHGREEE